MEENDLPNSEITDLPGQPGGQPILAAILFLVLGGRELMSRRIDPDDGHRRRGPAPRRRGRPRRGTGATCDRHLATGVRHDQVLTLVAFVGVALVSLIFDKNIGFVSITAAVILSMLSPEQHKDTVKQIAWPTVLLVAGVSTYATILTDRGLARVRRQLGRRPRRRPSSAR